MGLALRANAKGLVKKYFHFNYPPRIQLFFIIVFVKLMAALLGGLGFVYNNAAVYFAGTAVWIMWFILLFAFALPQPDRFLAGKRWLKPAASAICAVCVIIGIVQIIIVPATGLDFMKSETPGQDNRLASSLLNVYAYNDATCLVHQAAEDFNAGLNPYAGPNVIKSMLRFEGSFDKLTPIRKGEFEDTFPYPSSQQLADFWERARQNPDTVPQEVVSKFGYPAASFIIPAPFLLAGITDIRWVFLILFLASVGISVRLAPTGMKLVVLLAFLASVELSNSIPGGETGFLYFPFLLGGWILARRNWTAAALLMGIAVSIKQIPWFTLPFFLILLWRTAGIQRTLKATSVIAVTFLAFNLPFIISDFGLWVNSILSPMVDNLFPLGVGVVTLVTSGFADIQNPLIFTILEMAVWFSGIIWYFFNCRKYPHTGLILGILPLFFAWRSLWPYFFYIDMILLTAVVYWDYTNRTEINSLQPEYLVKNAGNGP